MSILNEQRFEVVIKTVQDTKPVIQVVNARDEETAIELVKQSNPNLEDTAEITVRKPTSSFGPNTKPTNDGVDIPNPLGETHKKVKRVLDPETMEHAVSTVESLLSPCVIHVGVDYAKRLSVKLAENAIEHTYRPGPTLSRIELQNDGSSDYAARVIESLIEADTPGVQMSNRILGIKN